MACALTYQQLWYVTQVYPEHVSAEEAAREFASHGADESCWRSALKVACSLGAK